MHKPRFTTQDLIHLIIPLIIDQTLASTLGMFDTIMVAAAGEGVVAGVSLVNTINVLLNYLFVALATGGAIVAGNISAEVTKKTHVKRPVILSWPPFSFPLWL